MISASVVEYLKKGIFTFLGVIVAVYLFVILLSYTGNDPSWSHISSDMTTINNIGGAMGAWLSDLLYSFFGFGAWWLLGFLIYESILIWWDSKPTFWLFRLVAYIFLLLSASALFAQLAALIQQVADPIVTGLRGIAGGIVGLELQARLAQLLTKWGSMAFLSLFVAITATFAFNIHWQALYHKIIEWALFSSAMRAENNNTSYALSDDEVEATNSASIDEMDTSSNEDSTSRSVKRKKADYGQLPLELQQTHDEQAAVTTNNRFSNALTDFLAKSELSVSVKASMAAAKSEIMSDKLQPATATANYQSKDNLNETQTAAPSLSAIPLRKVEPSFAWNDAGTVDDLLATEVANDYLVPAPAAPVSEPIVAPEFVATTQSELNSVVETTDKANTRSDKVDIDIVATDVDQLASSWLEEHADVDPVSVTNDSTDNNVANNSANNNSIVKDSATTDVTSENSKKTNGSRVSYEQKNNAELDSLLAIDIESQPKVKEPTKRKLNVLDSVEAAAAIQLAEEPLPSTDMTPTNTPPSNPKVAPTAAAKPMISFAVAEGEASNHIVDMMPDDYNDEDDDTQASTMPDIHDDEAFSQRSRSMQTAAHRANLSPIPKIAILDKPDPDRQPSYTVAELEQLSELLEIKLQEFNVKATVVNAIPGPVVTRFEVDLAAGVKASKVTGISRDLARSLSMASLRVVEVIPGKPYIGIEVPNKQREMVRLIELLNTEKFKDSKAQISMAMGKDIGGKPIITDLARAPHMLVAGTTGSGKSVLVNAMLLSMLLKYTPNELRLILIDPKQLELANYNDIPHLLTPVVTDMTEAASALSWCVAEMERRYQLMSLLKVRKLNDFNKKVRAAEKAGKPMLDPLWRPNDNVSISQAPKLKTLPMIVIVADEFADMIMQVGKQAEELITRLAQKSRAAGIHLILATQRPSVDVITGLIKANIPVRVALRVNSKVDSRTILDSGGAEDMLGNGDMLFLGPGQIEPDRVHGAYVSDEEVNSVCDAWRERGAPDYIDNMAGNFELSSSGGGGSGSSSGEDDDLYNDAVAFIMETRKVSASSIQRKFSIGYNRAARIVDSMEEAGLVSSMGKSGKRELLM